MIRKPGGTDLIEPKELADATRILSDALNREYDYVPPTTNFKEDFAMAEEIEAEFQTGSIRRSTVENTFKGTLSKEAFYEAIEGKT